MHTEIFATFGPACGEESILKEMIQAGMTGMRLNLSHTTLPDSRGYIDAYRNAAGETGVKPQILIDMQGPELRVGSLFEDLELNEGDMVCLCSIEAYKSLETSVAHVWKKRYIPIPENVIHAAAAGDEILLDDGKILIKVVEYNDGGTDDNAVVGETASVLEKSVHKLFLQAQVFRGGILRSHKSVKIVDKNVYMPSLTVHDIENIKLANDYGVTALMQPFVLSGSDLRYVRNVLKEHHVEHVKIYAKIENRQGVEQIEDILPEADALIIARGDLGNDMTLWELPRVQKQIEEACKKAGKPYIVVTQMLASMEQNPVPTRAEVSDIFHAVYHGAWGVMVTGETAVGRYPVEAVRYLANTAANAEEMVK